MKTNARVCLLVVLNHAVVEDERVERPAAQAELATEIFGELLDFGELPPFLGILRNGLEFLFAVDEGEEIIAGVDIGAPALRGPASLNY